MTRHPSEHTVLYRNGRRAYCRTCGQRAHGRHLTQTTPEPDERMTIWRLAGLTLFVLLMWGVLLYALPILGLALVELVR